MKRQTGEGKNEKKNIFIGSLSCGGDKLADIGYRMMRNNVGGQVHYTQTRRQDLCPATGLSCST